VGALHRPSDLEQECNHNRPPSAKGNEPERAGNGYVCMSRKNRYRVAQVPKTSRTALSSAARSCAVRSVELAGGGGKGRPTSALRRGQSESRESEQVSRLHASRRRQRTIRSPRRQRATGRAVSEGARRRIRASTGTRWGRRALGSGSRARAGPRRSRAGGSGGPRRWPRARRPGG
jgi:hypothetical protein